MQDLNSNVSNQVNEVKQQNSLQRIIGIVVSPGETMEGLADRPRILFPILLIVLSLPLFFLSRFSLFQDYTRNTIEMNMQNSNVAMSPEQMEMGVKIGTISGIAGAPIGALIAWLVGAAVLFGLVKLFKGEGRFKQFLSITGYAYIIMVLYYILSAVVSIFSGELYVNTSLALLVPDMKGSFIYGFLRGIDLFGIWQYVVIGIGIASLSKLSKVKVYSMIGAIIFVTALIGAASVKMM